MSDNYEPLHDAVTNALLYVKEHAETVVILASGTDDNGNTFFYKAISGNAHAAEGIAREYLRQLEGYQNGYFLAGGQRDFNTINSDE